jgi:hypothetical protein
MQTGPKKKKKKKRTGLLERHGDVTSRRESNTATRLQQ